MRRALTFAVGLLAACTSEPPRPVGGFVVPDAQVEVDAGANSEDAEVSDAGAMDAGATPDAGQPADAGVDVDGGIDAGHTADAGLPPAPCAFAAPTTDRATFDALLACLRDPTATDADKRAARDRAIDAIEARDGFPIVTAQDVTFVYVRDAAYDVEDDANPEEDFALAARAEPIRVTGDFDGWALAPSAALQPESQDLFHVTLPLDVAASDRWGYKFVSTDGAGDDVWFSDPLSRRFDYDANGRISLVRGGTQRGHLELVRRVVATRLGNVRDVYVYLPRGYEGASARYPVLYMHDGNNLFSANQPNAAPVSWEVDEVLEAEIAAGNLRPFIVVGVPNNAARRDEYTHVPDRTSSGLAGGDGADYAYFLVHDLKPRIDARYRSEPGQESTGVLGSSLGGLISYYVGLLHPSVFGFVGGMSSTFDWGRYGLSQPDMVQTYQTADLSGVEQVFYLDSGGGPPTGGCTTAAGSGDDNYCSTVRMRDLLVAEGFDTFPDDPDVVPLTPTDIEILHWWTPDAPHHESAWHDRIHRAFRLFARP